MHCYEWTIGPREQIPQAPRPQGLSNPRSIRTESWRRSCTPDFASSTLPLRLHHLLKHTMHFVAFIAPANSAFQLGLAAVPQVQVSQRDLTVWHTATCTKAAEATRRGGTPMRRSTFCIVFLFHFQTSRYVLVPTTPSSNHFQFVPATSSNHFFPASPLRVATRIDDILMTPTLSKPASSCHSRRRYPHGSRP